MQITHPSQYGYAKVQYKFAVTSGLLSNRFTATYFFNAMYCGKKITNTRQGYNSVVGHKRRIYTVQGKGEDQSEGGLQPPCGLHQPPGSLSGHQ